tara:strand:+ start:216 stop:557 length:342 start_codon:yes stop_codon:yes gene_type:complete
MKDSNVLIAEFMGEPYYYADEERYYYADDEGMEFHTSWDWLMPVVEKIESFEDDDKCCKYNVNIQQSWVEILDNENLDEIVFMTSCGTLLTKKELVYLAVVEFINWYNKNQKA